MMTEGSQHQGIVRGNKARTNAARVDPALHLLERRNWLRQGRKAHRVFLVVSYLSCKKNKGFTGSEPKLREVCCAGPDLYRPDGKFRVHNIIQS